MSNTEGDARAPATLSSHPSARARGRPDRLIFVYDGDSGLAAMLLDVVKKAAGREECALCEITYGPLGKRNAWRACEARLGLIVDELHRDELPQTWGISRRDLPCVLGRTGASMPFVLVTRDEIIACAGDVRSLEERLAAALSDLHGKR